MNILGKQFSLYRAAWILSLSLLVIGIVFSSFLFSQKPTERQTPTKNKRVIPPQSKPLETPGTYLIDESPVTQAPSELTDYSITYIEDGDYFIISIYKRPLEKTRKEAEKAFLEKMNITQKEACGLNVTLGVVSSIDQNLSGQNFGLSFCSGSIPFLENTVDAGDKRQDGQE